MSGATASTIPPPALGHLPALDRCGRYDLLGRLGTGGMAEIFLARETLETGARYVVVKRILDHVADDETFVQMFLDEARLATRLHHPNVCHVYEIGRDGDDYFMAMEWVRGVTLRDLERRVGPGEMPIEVAMRIARDVAGALHYAHRLRDDDGNPLGIVHRDVSPHNVMIGWDGVVKLLDFGIAKAKDASTHTRTGQIKGKFAYMAPEQCMQLGVDARSDVFALGILLYEALTGRNPFKHDTDVATMRAIVDLRVPPSPRAVRPDLPEKLDAIVQQALTPRPDDRFQTAGAMQIALDRALVETGDVVNESTVSAFLAPIYRKEIARGPKLKTSGRRRRDGFYSTSGTRSVAADGTSRSTSAPSAASHTSGLSEVELDAIARAADAEAQAMARGHARKLVLLGLALLLAVAGAFYFVSREALGGGGDGPEAGGEPTAGEGTPAEPAGGPRFRVVVPPGEEPAVD